MLREEMREVRHVEKPPARPMLLTTARVGLSVCQLPNGGCGRFAILEYPHNPTLRIPPQSTAM